MDKEFTITWNPSTNMWLHKKGLVLNNVTLITSDNDAVREIIFRNTQQMLPDSVLDDMREVPSTHKGRADIELTFIYQ